MLLEHEYQFSEKSVCVRKWHIDCICILHERCTNQLPRVREREREGGIEGGREGGRERERDRERERIYIYTSRVRKEGGEREKES